MQISINRHLINKASSADLARCNGTFESLDVNAAEFARLVSCGYAFCAQHKEWRKGENFVAAGFLAVDMDHGLTLEAALADSYVQEYASFVYTTPSHRPEAHRFRIVFELETPITVEKAMRNALTGLIAKFGADGSCKDACRLFFGSSDGHQFMIGKTLPHAQLHELLIRAEERAVVSDSAGEDVAGRRSATRSKIDLAPETPVRLAGGGVVALRDIPSKVRIHCPQHVDQRPSALALRNRWGTPGIYCSTCNATYFMKDGSRWFRDSYEFDYHWQRILTVSYEEYELYAEESGYVNLSKLRGGRIRQLDSQFLPYDEVSPTWQSPLEGSGAFASPAKEPLFASDCRVTLVKSPKGSGKTEWLRSLVQSHRSNGAKVLLIGHRRALINATAARIGLTSYLGSSFDPNDPSNPRVGKDAVDHYAICVDSLPNLDPRTNRYEIVLIDEVEQVLAHLLSGTLRENRRDALHTLRFYVNNASSVYLLDADVGRVTIELINEMFDDPAQSYQAIINHWKPEGRTIHLFEGREPHHLTGELVASLARGERCFVCSNSKRLVDELHQFVPKYVTRPLKTIAITSENSQTPEIQDFIANAKTRALDYDVIFASPAIGTGIDITFEDGEQHIDTVFGFFRERINTHFDIDQQLSRVRNPKHVKVWLSPAEFNFETDPEVIRAELEASQSDHRPLIGIAADGTRRYLEDSLYDTVFSSITAAQRASKNRLRHHFVKLREANGWTVVPVARDKDLGAIGRTIGKEAKAERLRIENERILLARQLSETSYEDLKEDERRDRLAEEDRPALRRYEIESFYLEGVSNLLLELDDQGSFRQAVRNYELLMSDDQRLKELDHEDQRQLTPDRPQRFQRKAVLREMLEASGVMSGGCFSRIAEIDASMLEKFVISCRHRKVEIERLFSMDVRKDLAFKPMRQLQEVLRTVGLKASKVRRDQSGGKSRVIYQLDYPSLEQMESIAARRGDPDQRAVWNTLRIRSQTQSASTQEAISIGRDAVDPIDAALGLD